MVKAIRSILAVIFVLVMYASAHAQCFYIKDILVDACGTPEGANEMVKLQIGPSNLNTSSLSITWPNNSFKGICQNSTTAKLIKDWNASIKSCGYLLEPTSGVLPAHKQVLIITSTSTDPSAHSFADISDTLYVIFQCSGNTSGHFVNYSSSSTTRTTKISFGGSCSESVTYDAHNLVDQSGKKGAQDGGSVAFDTAGNASYYNNGCRPPSVPVSVFAGNDTSICPLTKLTLKGTTLNMKNPKWTTSGKGSFGNDTLLNTTYTMVAADTGTTKLFLTAKTTCGKIIDTLIITPLPSPKAKITPDTALACVNQSIQLSSTAANYTSLAWSGGNGTFSSKTITNPTYTPAVKDTGSFIRLFLQSSGNCSPAKDTIVLKVSPVPAVKAGRDTSLCTGSTLPLHATATVKSLKWTTTGNGTFGNDTLLNTTYKMGTNDTVSVNLYLNGKTYCGKAGDTLVITALRYPKVKISPDTALACVGKSLQLSAKASYYTTLAWTGGNGTFSSKTIASPTYTPAISDTGSFIRLFLLATRSCTPAKDTIVLRVSPLPIINAGRDTAICIGATLPLKASSNLKSIKWTSSGNGVFGNDTLLNTTYRMGSNDTIPVSLYINGKSTCGKATDTLVITAKRYPKVKISTDTMNACLGNVVQLSAKASYYTTLAWSGGYGTFNNKTILAPMYTPSVKDTANFTMLILQGTGNCTPAKDTLILKVNAKPILKAGKDTTICTGTVLPLKASTNLKRIKWTSSGNGTFGNDTLPNTTYTLGTNDTIKVNLYIKGNSICGSASDTVVLSVQRRPTVKMSAIALNGCLSKGIQLSAKATYYTSLAWSGGNGSFSSKTISNPIYTPSAKDTGKAFMLVLTASGNCSPAKDSLQMKVIDKPRVDAGKDTTLCRGIAFQLNGSSNQASSLKWTGGRGSFSNSAILNPTYTPGGADTAAYYLLLTASNYCGTVKDSAKINQKIQTRLKVSTPDTACIGQPLKLTGTSSASPYTWAASGKGSFINTNTLNPTYTPVKADAGITYISLSSSDACGAIKDSAILYTRPAASIGLSGISSGICRGTSVSIKASATPGSISWTSSGKGTITNVNASNIIYKPGHDDTLSVKIYARLKDGCASVADSMTITYLPVPNLSIESINNACAGQPVIIHYHPRLDSVSLIGGTNNYAQLNDSTIIYYSGKTESQTTMTLKGKGSCGKESINFNIMYAPIVRAAFTYSPGMIQVTDLVSFQNLSTGANRYHWDFGDNLGYSTDKDPVYTYSHYGDKGVHLVAYNDYCSDTASIVIPIKNLQYFIIPNIFSPNDDEINDLFVGKGIGIRLYHIQIYNRWGELVFESNDITKGWDGKFHGKDAPESVYHYQVSIAFDPNGFGLYSGQVTLIR